MNENKQGIFITIISSFKSNSLLFSCTLSSDFSLWFSIEEFGTGEEYGDLFKVHVVRVCPSPLVIGHFASLFSLHFSPKSTADKLAMDKIDIWANQVNCWVPFPICTLECYIEKKARQMILAFAMSSVYWPVAFSHRRKVHFKLIWFSMNFDFW